MLIIHGENQISSRQFFLDIKTKTPSTKQKVDLRGEDLELPGLTTAAGSSSLFGLSNIVFIDNLFSRRPSNTKTQLIDYLKAHPDSDIYIWEAKDVTTQLKSFPPLSIKRFDLPKYIFQYLDNFDLESLHKSLESVSEEQILSMLAKQVHKLIVAKSGSGDYPPWQKNKLLSQSKQYSDAKLVTMLNALLDIDYKNKNSQLPYNLSVALELWTLTALQ
jgi:DNA polymerase III delta subunit